MAGGEGNKNPPAKLTDVRVANSVETGWSETGLIHYAWGNALDRAGRGGTELPVPSARNEIEIVMNRA